MGIFKCYFSGEYIALSIKKQNNNNGVSMELGKTNRLKVLSWCKLIHEINKLCDNNIIRQNMKIRSIC